MRHNIFTVADDGKSLTTDCLRARISFLPPLLNVCCIAKKLVPYRRQNSVNQHCPRAERDKENYFGLTLLGVCDRTTPALASEVAQLPWPVYDVVRSELNGTDIFVTRYAEVI